MHTEGIEERTYEGSVQWFIRSECRGCGLRVGIDRTPSQTDRLVDRLMWTDEALHRLDRLPPYVASLFREEVEQDVRSRDERVVSYDALFRPRSGARIEWDSEAEHRLENVPAPVRAMAKIELERTAAERGHARITASLMEEVKARYFGMGAAKK
ncbi:hypothetical protein W02_15070 [Nitrospira sp. KM1]|uniref:PCP reductase family protein n=1 Tax=Nitrospira sp. KM1 TaxID=1936990 RepID=UPI0013A718E7|nr:PCP reductase family protein [Nitrospira sp. KM1]BCA54367.1 hypothetical protein W02_15070 [Nitrospira sp. KM1]